MCRRFFVDHPIEGSESWLEGPEAQHLSRVLRAKVGDQIVLFDGSGAEFPARIVRMERSRVDLQVLARRPVDRELHPPLVLAVALPKGDRQRWLVEKAVELGVTRLVPLITQRGVAQPVDKALERLQRTVAEASKQCGRNRLMEISPPQTLRDCFTTAPPEYSKWIAHPSSTASRPPQQLLSDSDPRPLLIAIGPEGGFTDDEVATGGGDCQLVTLGLRILRIETAALALASLVSLYRAPQTES